MSAGIITDLDAKVFRQLSVLFLLVGRWDLAFTLLRRGCDVDRVEARHLLHMALGDAQRLKLPEAQQIGALIPHEGLGDEEIASLRSQ